MDITDYVVQVFPVDQYFAQSGFDESLSQILYGVTDLHCHEFCPGHHAFPGLYLTEIQGVLKDLHLCFHFIVVVLIADMLAHVVVQVHSV